MPRWHRLFGYLHRSEFGANASSNSATHDQTGNNWSSLVDDRKHDRGRKQRFRSESGQAVTGFQGEHNAGCGAGQCD